MLLYSGLGQGTDHSVAPIIAKYLCCMANYRGHCETAYLRQGIAIRRMRIKLCILHKLHNALLRIPFTPPDKDKLLIISDPVFLSKFNQDESICPWQCPLGPQIFVFNTTFDIFCVIVPTNKHTDTHTNKVLK